MDSAEFLLGTVMAVSSADGVQIRLDGQDEAMSKYYKMLITGANWPSVGDRVVIMKHSGTYVVMGKIGTPSQDAGKVNRGGDTMTGALTMNGADINLRSTTNTIGTVPDTSQSDRRVYFRDKLNTILGKLQSVFMNDGRVGMQLGAQRTINGSSLENNLALTIDANGDRFINISSAAPWRKALGLGTNGAFPITVAQGGTGNTGTATVTTLASIATAGTNITLLDATFSNWGKLAMLYVHGKTTAAIADNAVLFTVVSGKRPVSRASAQIGRSPSHCAMIGTDGTAVLGGSISSGTEFSCFATYLLP